MPTYPLVDAHVHLWDPQRFRMTWLDGLEPIARPFGPADYREQTAGLSIEAFIFVETAVEPAYAFLEAQMAAQLAEQEPRLRGIVAAAPLEHGARARAYLAALAALGPRVKGVRRLLQDEPDARFCLRPDFLQGVRLLPEFGFSFDICIRYHQLAAATELVRQCPEVAFVLDHIAKPAIARGQQEPWRAELRSLAALPNVYCKISGMVTEADQQGWASADLAPYVAHVLDVFGAERVMFGSDWPVVLLASGYRRWVETLEQLTAALPPEAQRGLWAENARRFYRLGAA